MAKEGSPSPPSHSQIKPKPGTRNKVRAWNAISIDPFLNRSVRMGAWSKPRAWHERNIPCNSAGTRSNNFCGTGGVNWPPLAINLYFDTGQRRGTQTGESEVRWQQTSCNGREGTRLHYGRQLRRTVPATFLACQALSKSP